MTFIEACREAARRSRENSCTQHVCATIAKLRSSNPDPSAVAHYVVPTGYTISDWYDETVVATYDRGKELTS